jgi:glycosyltransferase involved in cell wall biosynthesis
MEIAFLSSHHPRERSMGLSHIVSWIGQYLARWGHEVSVLYPSFGEAADGLEDRWEGIRAIGVPTHPRAHLPFGAQLDFSFHASRRVPPTVDIIVANNELGGRFAMGVPRRTGTPASHGRPVHLATFHGISARFLEMGRPLRGRGVRSTLGFHADDATIRWFEGGGARRADRCIACSPGVARDLAGFYRVDPGRIRVILNGVETATPVAPEERERARASLGIPPGTFVLSFLARDPWRKGLDVARAAVRLLREQGLPVLLLNAGNADPPSEGVRTLGVVPEERKREVLAASDVFYLPTRYEGLPAVVQEAAALGIPTVTTPEANLDGNGDDPGFVEVPGGDVAAHARALAELYRDPVLRGRLAQRGRELMGKRSFEQQAQEYLALFEEVLPTRPAR